MEAEKKLIPLSSLASGQSGIVKTFEGGHDMKRRLHALGVREGKKVKKLGGGFMCGPLTVQIGTTKIGIGHGMACKIMVEKSQ